MAAARGSVQRRVLDVLAERPGERLPRSELTVLVFGTVTPAGSESVRRAVIALWRRELVSAEYRLLADDEKPGRRWCLCACLPADGTVAAA